MLKAMLVLLLAAASAGAAARDTVWTWDKPQPKNKGEVAYPEAKSEWVKVGSQATFTLFVDPSSILRMGNNVTMSHLYELQIIDEVAGKPIRSVTARAEYDCMQGQTRILSSSAYSGSMARADPYTRNGSQSGGQLPPVGINVPMKLKGSDGAKIGGVVNRITDPGNWKPVTPGSTEEMLMKFACGK